MAECDLALLEIIKNGFEAVADEMAIILMRTAHSPIVRDAMDFSTALCDPYGQNIAQGLTTPMHLGSFYDAMQNLIGQYEGDINDGDIFIGNDPYIASGQHLPDIYVIKPIFHAGALCGWAATIAHHVDVGGLVPGSNSLSSTSIHQEGLRLPFLKLLKKALSIPLFRRLSRPMSVRRIWFWAIFPPSVRPCRQGTVVCTTCCSVMVRNALPDTPRRCMTMLKSYPVPLSAILLMVPIRLKTISMVLARRVPPLFFASGLR